MFHAASMGGVLGVPASGAVSTFVPMFEPGAVIDNIEAHGVDWTMMVPTMIALMLQHPSFTPQRVSSMRDLVYGASPMPAASRPASHGKFGAMARSSARVFRL